MKQLSVLMMLVSLILNTLSTLIHLINRSFVSLSIFYPTVSLFLRYGELLFLFGLIGLWLGTKKDKSVKWLSLLAALVGGIRFFLIEFSIFDVQGFIPILLQILLGLIMIGIMLKVASKDCPLVVIKGYVTIGFLSIYIIHTLMYGVLESYQSLSFSTEWMIPIFYMVYQLALFIYFKEWYREGFQYQNEVLYHM